MQTLIIGGGLCGLALAEILQIQGHDYMLVEARQRFGGRVKTRHYGGGGFDLGPAWFWPGQPRMAAMIDRLDLVTFAQYSCGQMVIENEQGSIQKGRTGSALQTSWRLEGGLETLTDRLASRLPDERKRLAAAVKHLSRTSAGIVATLKDGDTLIADRVVMALPPRIAAQIEYSPPLATKASEALKRIPSWMAGQAKAVAIYEKPFWREADLSGQAISYLGPLAEIHDATSIADEHFALFGFIGISPGLRSDEALLRQQITTQLVRLFGEEAARPDKLIVKDWANDPFTATHADQVPLQHHPAYGMPSSLTGLWDNQLFFAGSELATQFGGYLEGALEAAENVINTFGQPKGR